MVEVGYKRRRGCSWDRSWFSSSTGWVVLSEPQTKTPKVRDPAGTCHSGRKPEEAVGRAAHPQEKRARHRWTTGPDTAQREYIVNRIGKLEDI